MTMSILQVDRNIRTQIQVPWGPPGSLSTRSLSFSQHLGPSKSSASLYCSVCNSYQSKVKSIKVAEKNTQVNWKYILGIGLKKKIWFNDDFDSNDIVLSHKWQLLERPVRFAILLICVLLQICAGLNGQWLSATELKLWRILILQQSEATLEGNSCLNSV